MSKFAELETDEQELCLRILGVTRPWLVRYAPGFKDSEKDPIFCNALKAFYSSSEVDSDLRIFARQLAVKLEPPPKNQGEHGEIVKLPAARRSGGTPTKAQRRRWGIMQEIGCIPCILEGDLRGENRRGTQPDMDHIVEGYRLGHDETYASCPWHHRGVPPIMKAQIFKFTGQLGPSKAVNPSKFHERYGSDYDLLLIQEQEISLYLDNLIGEVT